MQLEPTEMAHREYHVARIHPLSNWAEERLPRLDDLHGSDGSASSSSSSTSYNKYHLNDHHEVEMDDNVEGRRQPRQKSQKIGINALISSPFSADNDGRGHDINERSRQYNYAGHYTDRSRHRSNRQRRCSCSVACLCCAAVVLLLLLLLLLVVAAAVLYLILLPKAPTFSVADAHVSKFNLTAHPVNHHSMSMSSTSSAAAPDDQQRRQPAAIVSYLQTDVSFTVRAGNPNKKIAIDYQHILVTLLYEQLVIGSGSLPAFYLASGDAKQLQLEMKGEDTPLTPQTIAGDSLHKALVTMDHGGTGTAGSSNNIALQVQTVTHARVKVWKWMSHAPKFRVDCNVEITNPSSPKDTRLLSKTCKLKVVNLWT